MAHDPAFTVWFTGLPQSGKSTLADLLAEELRGRRGLSALEILDGDVIRTELCKGLGFSREDRDENIRRIAFVCKVLTRAGVPNIVAAVSPYREARERARAEVGRFVEVHCAATADQCAARDYKGNYAKARAGEIHHFTGVDDPYEPPEDAELSLDTVAQTPEQCVALILAKLEQLGYLGGGGGPVYSASEEQQVASHLESLGYM
ncbi:MAG: adenylyl-sulfate kinase [Gaiellales bacterium]